MNAKSSLQTILLLCALAAFGSLCHYYSTFFADDSYISFRYAQRLIDGKGLTWSDGERVEGYSNFLWIILLSIGGIFSRDIELVARVLNILLFLTIFSAPLYLYRIKKEFFWPAISASLLVSCTVPIAVWAMGSLETILLGALFIWSMVLILRTEEIEGGKIEKFIIPTMLGLILLARADGFILTAGIVMGFLFLKGSLGRTLKIIIIPSLILISHILFRYYYYGEFVPNTFFVKFAVNDSRFARGIAYWLNARVSITILISVFFIMLGYIYVIKRNLIEKIFIKRILFIICSAGIWTFYIILTGSDIFPSYRHLVPVYIAIILMISESLRVFQNKGYGSPVLLFSALIIISGCYIYIQIKDPVNQKARYERWEAENVKLGKILKDYWKEKEPLLAVTAAGALVYAAEMNAIDMLGLNDKTVADNKKKGFGESLPGHELHPPPGYIMSRYPDFIIFSFYDAPRFFSGNDLKLLYQNYKKIIFSDKSLKLPGDVWINIFGRAGIRYGDDGITIPAYFFGRDDYFYIYDIGGKPGIIFERGVYIYNMFINAGSYNIAVFPEAPVPFKIYYKGKEVCYGSGATKCNISEAGEYVISLMPGQKTSLAYIKFSK